MRRVCAYPQTPGIYHDPVYSVRADHHHLVNDLSVSADFQVDVCRDHLIHAIGLPVDNMGWTSFHISIIEGDDSGR